jgi:hypothetical protein
MKEEGVEEGGDQDDQGQDEDGNVVPGTKHGHACRVT